VKGGKGNKERYITLSELFLAELRGYYKDYEPDYWLSEGQSGGKYSNRSVQMILRNAVKNSGAQSFLYCAYIAAQLCYAFVGDGDVAAAHPSVAWAMLVVRRLKSIRTFSRPKSSGGLVLWTGWIELRVCRVFLVDTQLGRWRNRVILVKHAIKI
jgi:hypothetical protein